MQKSMTVNHSILMIDLERSKRIRSHVGGYALIFCSSSLLYRMVAGLYFSAHWCPPCRGFTPELAKFYKQMKEKVGDKLEIVFISSDRGEADWKGYFAEMPWLALPFSARDIKVSAYRGHCYYHIFMKQLGYVVIVYRR